MNDLIRHEARDIKVGIENSIAAKLLFPGILGSDWAKREVSADEGEADGED